MSKASVSVIIPCYCCSGTIRRAVESVVQQTLQPAEVILVDDASRDETLSVLKALQEEYSSDWIKILSLESNGGPSVARNAAWNIATQDYIAFLDADNAWHKDKILIQYYWMLANPQALLSGHTIPIVFSYEKFLSTRNISFKQDIKYNRISKEEILRSNPFETSSIMLQRDIKYRFDISKRYSEDYFLWQQICLDGHPCFLLNVQLSYIFNSFGTAGLTSRILKMRLGDFNNYWQLWRKHKISVQTMIFMIFCSAMKFLALMIIGPEKYSLMKHRIIFGHYET
ncbi:glycosyltransferase family 2 protein [Mastigocoleus sp. MO_188.B34]|uniref:glycosyltransferase family 2 protein n=1 Tax=Mastigocoleus sp. MO_188.B34 TaxID=3036635 RepID=UPI0026297ED9|nr:glycosyltransferase family 2 protein [Mastigocoleus sp. MO_188.B34]MDJ0696543.1 glycosyltransferase family 2 protein [Mastigocoleus sp. MO_188.B34]